MVGPRRIGPPGLCTLPVPFAKRSLLQRRLSQNGPEIFPLLPQFRQERDEARILSKVIQIGIPFEQRVAGKAIVSRRLQPFDRLLRFVHNRISAGDVISSVMKMCEPLPFSMALLILRSSVFSAPARAASDCSAALLSISWLIISSRCSSKHLTVIDQRAASEQRNVALSVSYPFLDRRQSRLVRQSAPRRLSPAI